MADGSGESDEHLSVELVLELAYDGVTDSLPLRDWNPGDPVPDEWFESVYSEIPGMPGKFILDEERLVAHVSALTQTIDWLQTPSDSSLIDLVPSAWRGLLRYYFELEGDSGEPR